MYLFGDEWPQSFINDWRSKFTLHDYHYIICLINKFFSLSPSAAWLCSWHVTCSQTSTHITQGSLPALCTCWESIIMTLRRWRRASHVSHISSNSSGGPWLKISTTYTSRCFNLNYISYVKLFRYQRKKIFVSYDNWRWNKNEMHSGQV